MILGAIVLPWLWNEAVDTFAQCGGWWGSFGLPLFDGKRNIWADDPDCVIGQDMRDITVSPIEQGAWNPWTNLAGDAFTNQGEVLTDSEDAWTMAMNLIRGIVNYALWLIALVALLYLLYHGFLALTAGTNNEKMQQGLSGIKYAWMALAGVAVARFLISIVIFVLDLIITST